MNIPTYTASELIRKYNDRDAGLYKEVVSVSANQYSLVNALRSISSAGPYLLDGHFVIRSKGDGISLVPLATFEAIAPRGLILVTGDPEMAAQRMFKRDARCLSVTELDQMQCLEIEHGRFVGKQLGVRMLELHLPTAAKFAFSVSELIDSETE